MSEESRLGNDTGWQIRLKSGQIVNIFDKGTFNVQGKNPEIVRKLMGELGAGSSGEPPQPSVSRDVFVVYGHDTVARDQLEAMLRRWKLNPLLLDQLPSEGQTLIEKLEKHQNRAAFAVVLATPDDEGHKAGHPEEKAFRARQNVVLELGMMLAILGRPRVAILLKDQQKMERPSDIQGLIYIPFKDEVKDAGPLLAKEMSSQGISIDVRDL
ncbi:MAG TPA: TIR domain-containing protein [Candidatus Binataceae bacterium]|nr:TIR domain-containing protein [Candidatus Binataceae bacterium]